jgi:hypothetical protein
MMGGNAPMQAATVPEFDVRPGEAHAWAVAQRRHATAVGARTRP